MPFGDVSEVHRWLTSEGFKRNETETRHYVYDGKVSCNNIEVPVQVVFSDLSFLELPKIYLKDDRPAPLERPLPHVDHKGRICYLDEQMYRVDPYNPVQTFSNLIDLARKVLIDSINGKNSSEVGYEFGAYWQPIRRAILLSEFQSASSTHYRIIKHKNLSGEESTRCLIGTEKDIEAYRNYCSGQYADDGLRNAYCLSIEETSLLPVSGHWPPDNFFQFYRWLNNVSEKSAKKLYHWLGTKEGAKKSLMVLLKTKSAIVGVEVSLEKGLAPSTNHPARFRKLLISKAGAQGAKFTRQATDDFTPKYLTTRNLVNKNLSGKRLSLIGCGNIGGYLSRLLVQAGAGLGGGKLMLFDGQQLSPGNVGRHYLDVSHIYENKALACRHKLLKEYPFADVSAYEQDFRDISLNSKNDLLIDATGREPFSFVLNEKTLKLRKENKSCPDVVYVWIDANGLCARTLFYNGSKGCYRCLQDLAGSDRYPPYNSEKDIVPVSYQCGESYIPYPPSVSCQAAALCLDTSLDWVNGKYSPSFRQRRFSKGARDHKDQNLKQMYNCPACQS